LPKAMVERLGLRAGDEVDIGRIVRCEAAADAERAERLQWLLELERKYPARLPEGYKFDRDEANSRGD